MQANWRSEFVLLGLLAERPVHGYELAQLVSSDEALCAIWRIERSQCYFLLRKLLEKGYITETAEEQGGGPPRVVYAATASGRAVLAAWLREPESSPRGLRNAFLAKLYLAVRSDQRLAQQLVDAQKTALRQWAMHHEERAGASSFAALVHRLRLSQVLAALETLEELDLRALDLAASEAPSTSPAK